MSGNQFSHQQSGFCYHPLLTTLILAGVNFVILLDTSLILFTKISSFLKTSLGHCETFLGYINSFTVAQLFSLQNAMLDLSRTSLLVLFPLPPSQFQLPPPLWSRPLAELCLDQHFKLLSGYCHRTSNLEYLEFNCQTPLIQRLLHSFLVNFWHSYFNQVKAPVFFDFSFSHILIICQVLSK